MIELQDKVKMVLEWLLEKKAENISTYDFTGKNSYTDYIIICEGQADLHVRAIGNHILDNVKANHFSVLSKEGIDYSHWVLVDLGEIIIHIFLPETRQYYKIDEFLTNYLDKLNKIEK